jgi:hypothetical protein
MIEVESGFIANAAARVMNSLVCFNSQWARLACHGPCRRCVCSAECTDWGLTLGLA